MKNDQPRWPLRLSSTHWLLIITMALALPIRVHAFSSYLNQFLSHYGTTTLDMYTDAQTGDDCLVCHVPSRRGTLGNAYRLDLIDNNVMFAALDNLDSDGDGIDNITEATTSRVDFPTQVDSISQVGYNPGLIDCPDGTLGYDPATRQVVTGVSETPPGGTIWQSEVPGTNCDDGLDNDCDGLADQDDPDCAGCSANADCEDGLFCTVDSCIDGSCVAVSACPPAVEGCVTRNVTCDEVNDQCVDEPDDALCDDGDVCNGTETCNVTSGACDSGVALVCDDGMFCNGAETCNPSSGCQPGTEPCEPSTEICNETADACEPAPECVTDADCNDGFFCTVDSCFDGSCVAVSACPPAVNGCVTLNASCDEVNDQCVDQPDDAFCDDGDVCNGTETCNVTSGACDSGVALVCDDGMFCNGAETCDPSTGCQAGAPVACDDGISCTIDSCNEATDSCEFASDLCNGLWDLCGAVSLADNWYWLDWFGYFNLAFDPWVYHEQHRFLFPFGDDCSGLVFWDNEMGAFWWTSASVYPFVYRFSDGEWLWYLVDSVDPRWFVILSSGEWEQWPPPGP